MLSVKAQETPPEPAPQATEIVTEAPTEALPTDAPTEAAPVSTQAVEVTIAPTEATPAPTQDVTLAPTEDVTPVPTSEVIATSEMIPTDTATEVSPTSALALAFSANFDAAYPAELSAKTNWLEVSVASGKALQASLGAVPVSYTPASFVNSAVEAKFLLNTGEAQVLLRGYMAGLNTDGTVTLYRNQVAVTSSTTTLTTGAWTLLRLQIVGGQITINVNGELLIDYAEAALLPEGAAGFAARNGAVLRVDDFAVYGIPTSSAPVETAAAPIEKTDEAVAEASLPMAVTCAVSPNSDMTIATQRNGVQSTQNYGIRNNEYALSGNGRYVVFISSATFGNAADTNGLADVFRFDRQTCTTARVLDLLTTPIQADRQAYGGVAVSDDGQVVAFGTSATNLGAGDVGQQVYVVDLSAPANPPELVSQDGSGTIGNGDSYLPVLSSDGNFVAFWTTSNNLVGGDTSSVCETDFIDQDGIEGTPYSYDFNENCPDVYAYDRTTDNVVRVSLADDESQGNGGSDWCGVDGCSTSGDTISSISISDDGNVVAFASYATNLVLNDTNEECDNVDPGDTGSVNCIDVFVRNITAGTTTLVSVNSDEVQGNSGSYRPVISADGNVVLFSSFASNLVTGDNNGASDVFLRDLINGTTERVSLRTNSLEINFGARLGWMSDDARYIVFTSYESAGSNPANVAVPSNKNQVFVYDRTNQTLARVSQSKAGAAATSNIYDGTMISNDGTRALFQTNAANLVAGDVNAKDDVFIAPVSLLGPLSVPTSVTVLANGLNINVTWTDTNTTETRYEIERYTGSYDPSIVGRTLVNATAFAESNVGCGLTLWYRVRAYRAADGFVSPWSAWMVVETAPCTQVCNPNAAIQRVSTGSDAAYQSTSTYQSAGRAISSDGRYILFGTLSPIVSNPSSEYSQEGAPGVPDVYLFDTQTCDITVVSEADTSTGGSTTQPAYPGALVDNNSPRFAFFSSAENNLTNSSVMVDTDGTSDVFLRDNTLSLTDMVSLEDDGDVSLTGDVYMVDTTPDGRYVLMEMAGPVSEVDDDNAASDLVLYDRDVSSETLSMVSLAGTNISTGNEMSFGGTVLVDPATNNVYVVFTSQAQDLTTPNNGCTLNFPMAPGCYEVYVRNMTTNTTTVRLSVADNEALSNGTAVFDDAVIFNGTLYVTFQSLATNLAAGTTTSIARAYLRTVPLNNLGLGTTQLIARASNTTGALGLGNGPSYGGQLSGNGRWVAFTSASSNLVAGDTNNMADVFVRDLVTNQTQRVSVTAANVQLTQASSVVDMSDNGQKILFNSAASTLVAGDTANVCEVDNIGTPDYNENCADLFVAANPLATLAAPLGFTASTTFADHINLAWVDGAGEQGYEIERSLNNGTTWTAYASLPADQTAYTITPLNCGEVYLVRLRSTLSDPYAMVSLPTAAVTGRTTACAAPALSFPGANGLINTSTPTFLWSTLNGVSTYEFDLSTVATFATHVAGYPLDVNDTDHTPAALPDGKYYWRVRAHGPGTGPYASLSFTIDTVAPAVPALTVPANLAVVRAWRPTFTWAAVPGATKYDLVVVNQASTPVITKTDFVGTSYIHTANLPQGNYSAQIRAKDAAGNMSAYSVAVVFTLNPAMTPAPNAVIMPVGAATTANVTFTWAVAPGATGTPVYTVQVDDDPSFSSVLPAQTCTTALATTATCTVSALPRGEYYWRVIRSGEVIVSAPLPSNRFFVSPAAPRAPRQLAPLNGKFLTVSERSNITLTWDWGGLADPAGGAFEYYVEVSTSSIFNITPIYTSPGAVSAQTTTIGSLPNGVYYWRVRAFNQFGVPGAWSTAFKFIVDNTTPGTTTVLAPSGFTASARPMFTWNAVPTAYRYEVEVNDTCGDGSPEYTSASPFIAITTTSFALPATANALAQGTHNVCVKAYNLSQNAGSFSAPKAFTVFLGTSPANNALVPATIKPSFAWTATPGTAGQTVTYNLQIDDDTDFTADLVYPATPLALTTASHILPTTLPSGTYYWRVVRSVNGTPETFTSNVYRTLFVGPLLPGPTLTLPYGGALYGFPIDLKWADLASGIPNMTISDYEVVVSKRPTFVPPFVTAPVAPGQQLYNFVPGPNDNPVTYYWRVRARSNGTPVSNWSATDSFRMDVVEPGVPNVTNPKPGTLVSTLRPTFSWLPVAGATFYQILVSDFTNGNPLGSGPQLVTGTSYTPNFNLPQTDINFVIMAYDGRNYSTPKNVFFSTRLGNQPAIGSTVTTNRPMFSWTAVPGATIYTLQIDDDMSFTTPIDGIGIQVNAPATSYTLSAAQGLTPGVYYWRVNHNAPIGNGFPASNGARVFNFSPANMPLKPVNLVLQNNIGATDDKIDNDDDAPITFTWTAMTPPPQEYEIQFSQTSTFASLLYPNTYDDVPPYSIYGDDAAFPIGTVYWRVRAIYDPARSNPGPWSDVKSFLYDTDFPAEPTILAPLTPTVSTARPTFKWGAVPTAVSYRLTVIDVFSGNPIFTDRVVTGTSYTLPITDLPLTQSNHPSYGYNWSVRAVDLAGNESNPTASNIKVFAGTSPTLGQFITDTTPTFTWTGVAGSTATWTLEVGTTDSLLPLTYTISGLPAATVSYTLPNAVALSPNTYYWRVYRAGEIIANLVGQPFTVVASLSVVTPALTGPVTNDLVNEEELDVGLTLTWSDLLPTTPLGLTLVEYALDISTSPLFTPVTTSTYYPTDPFFTSSSFADGTYYWRVAGRYSSNSTYTGLVSAVRSFKVDTGLPGAPTLTAPIPFSVMTNTRTPTFTWTAATGTPTQYVLEIDDDSDFSSIARTYIINAPALTFTLPPSQALSNSDYSWRVTARDAAGNPATIPSNATGATSLPRQFTIAIP